MSPNESDLPNGARTVENYLMAIREKKAKLKETKEEERMSNYVEWEPIRTWERYTENDNIKITGLQWPVTINTLTGWMKIGCEDRPLETWGLYNDKDILEKGGRGGLKFWCKYRHALFTLAGREYKEPAPKKERTYRLGQRFRKRGGNYDGTIYQLAIGTRHDEYQLLNTKTGQRWMGAHRVTEIGHNTISAADFARVADGDQDDFIPIEEE